MRGGSICVHSTNTAGSFAYAHQAYISFGSESEINFFSRNKEKFETQIFRLYWNKYFSIISSNPKFFTFQPENIMLQNKNSTQIKIIDFGLSRKIPPGASVQEMIGTPEFVGK